MSKLILRPPSILNLIFSVDLSSKHDKAGDFQALSFILFFIFYFFLWETKEGNDSG